MRKVGDREVAACTHITTVKLSCQIGGQGNCKDTYERYNLYMYVCAFFCCIAISKGRGVAN